MGKPSLGHVGHLRQQEHPDARGAWEGAPAAPGVQVGSGPVHVLLRRFDFSQYDDQSSSVTAASYSSGLVGSVNRWPPPA